MTSDGRALVLSKVSEEQWLQQVITWAKRAGWLTYHTRDSRRSSAGFPDLVCVRNGQVVFIEVKAQDGRLSTQQKVWLESLQLAGVETYVYRPADEDSVKRLLGVSACA